jgi:hypothetical protein
VTAVNALVAAVNELVDDHNIFRLADSSSNTLTDELRADHGSFVTLTSELKDDVDAMKASVTSLLQKMDGDFADVTNASTDYEASISVAANVAAADVAAITAVEASDPPPVLTNNDDIDPI